MNTKARTELAVLTAGDRLALVARARHAAELARSDREELSLRGLVCEIGEPRPDGPLSLAVVAGTKDELAAKLEHAADRLGDPDCRRINDRSGIFFTAEPLHAQGGTLALMFPGEGSQYPGMLSDLCVRFPKAREAIERIDRAFIDHPRGFLPSQLVFGGMEPDRLWDMDGAVEVVFSANAAVHAVLDSLALKPDVIVGHSTGDYSALFAAGAIRIDDESELHALMLGLNGLYQELSRDETVPDTPLLAVGAADPGDIARVLETIGSIELAMDNCPHQVVISGAAEALAEARARLSDRGAVLEELAFRRGYHTAAFRPALAVLEPFFDTLPLQAPRVPMWSCASASPVPADLAELKALTLEQWATPVRFRETIEGLWASGVRLFVESGPRGNLTAFVKDILRGRPHLAVACDGVHRPTVTHLQFALAQLAVHGVPLDLSPLAAPDIPAPPTRSTANTDAQRTNRRGPVLVLATGWPEVRLSAETAARLSAGARSAPAAAPLEPGGSSEQAPAALRPVPASGGPVEGDRPVGGRPLAGRDAAMAAHFEVTNRMLEAQEKVLTRFLAGINGQRAVPQLRPAPLLGARFRRNGDRLEAAVELSTARHLFLADHTLGGRVSTADAGLTALPVVPLTMTLELAAEAALELAPNHVCIGFEQVVAQRWITLDGDGRAELEVTAVRLPGSGPHATVAVEIGGAAARGGQPHLGTRVLLAPSFPPAPLTRRSGPCELPPWNRERVYREAMFHGPRFRGIEQVTHLDDDGAEAVLEVLPRRGLLADAEPMFCTDPVLLDQPGQLVGVWTSDRLADGFVIFPTRIERLELFSPPPPPGRRLVCRADIRLDGDTGVVSDLEVDDGAGRLHARFTAWEDRRFDVPRSFLAFMLDPAGSSICRPWAADAGQRGAAPVAGARVARPDLPPGFAARGGIWQQVVAGLTLTRDERRVWHASHEAADHGEQWLLGRLAAKDAARRRLAGSGLEVAPADIFITGDGDGELRATGGWQAAFGSELRVSVHFADGEARAEAAAAERDGATATAMTTSTDAGGASAAAAVPQTSANPAGRDARLDTQHRR
ncbi:MAG TPA: acyltransferase domain-containing protein [Chondromyces sp.]|nr:acyltransferase domain-containing protein [Chondromyces sp.]